MALALSTPAVTQSLPKDVETNPKKARAWIESLPLTKTIDSARVVTANISALNRAKLSAEERVELLEIYRPVIAVLLDELDAVCAYSILPMPPRQLEAFTLAQALLTECAHSYKLLLLEKTGKLLMFNAKKHLPLPLYRALSYLNSLMLQSYKTYHPVPAGVWRDFHALYQCAVEQNLGEGIVDEDGKQSIGELYIVSLLISLADPYRLMHKEVERAAQILAQNRGLTVIRDNAEGLDPQRLFVVALDSDQGPRILVQGTRPTGQVLRLVDPARLVERLQERLKAAGNAGAAKSHATHDLNDLMARLIRLWGDPPKRQFRRNPVETGVALCSSIKGVAYFAELAANENPEADAAAIRDGRTIPLLKIPQDAMSQLIGVEEWQVLNQSANGLRMHHESGGTVGVTVGEVVGVRFVGGRAWNVGVVRWLTLLEGDALEFGLELISPAATSITIESTIGSAIKPMPALLIAPLSGEADTDTVMTSSETFADLREYELVDHGDIRHVRATTLVERTSRFDMFQFQPS
ncbi:MAG TPA: hypothetical protein VF928_06830 [Usitatibacteraceae bacterium]